MLKQHNQSDIDSLSTEDYDILNLFHSEKEAIYKLYYQLLCTHTPICKKTILNSLKYLVFCKSMDNQMEEIQNMTTDDVDVVHHSKLVREVEKDKQELQKKLPHFFCI